MCAVLSGTSQPVRYHSYSLQLLWVLLDPFRTALLSAEAALPLKNGALTRLVSPAG